MGSNPMKEGIFSYLVKPMVQEDNLSLARVGMLPHQHVAWVRVTVYKTIDKDHLTVHLAQVAGDLKETQSSECSAPPVLAPGASLMV